MAVDHSAAARVAELVAGTNCFGGEIPGSRAGGAAQEASSTRRRQVTNSPFGLPTSSAVKFLADHSLRYGEI